MKPLTITHDDGTIEVLYTPTEKQAEFHARTEPNVLFFGGRGSGKSMALRWEAHMRALSYPGLTYCILRRTFPELQSSHLIHVPQEMKKLGGYYLHNDKIAVYPNGSRGFFRHCNTDEDVLNLLSAEFAWMGFDEVSTFEWEQFIKLAASVRVTKTSGLTAMVRACTNPLGASAAEVNKYFVTKDVSLEEDEFYNPDDWYSIKANLDDNPYVDRNQYLKRFSGMPEHVRKAWVEGEFSLENALFDVYPTKRVIVPPNDDDPEGGSGSPVERVIPYHYIPTADRAAIIKAGEIYCSFDMGYFPDPAYCLWVAHLGNRYIAFHEKIWYKTIAGDIALEIQEENKRLGITRVVATYCDPTLNINTGADIQTIKDIMESKGLPLECSINNRELYAQAIHTSLAEEAQPNVPRLQIYQKGCPYLAKTLPQMRFNPKRPLAMDDHPHDHPSVALAYFLISSGSMERRPMLSRQLPKWMQPKKGDRPDVLGAEGVKDRKYRYN